jgi:Rieske Fe-S protein
MKRAFATLVALLLAGSAAWAGEMTPGRKDQPGPPAKAPAQPAATKAKAVEGKIKTMDGSGKSVTLEDGTTLTIPDSLKAARGALREGAMVKATYEDRGGEKVVTSIEVLTQGNKPKS